ncbi:hypothetical protein QYE76_053946 [Lolium multiflorum]|uniref:Reverse transcriptase domain-containing protein n=1 Tax=Lolium multiflorum TaxID=4521 RepID=A0AAD8SXA0_LOLMU|nr:hypothetical protein QYE76_053946 [Lolium multiflorum]
MSRVGLQDSINPKPLSEGIAEELPRQLAPSRGNPVGTRQGHVTSAAFVLDSPTPPGPKDPIYYEPVEFASHLKPSHPAPSESSDDMTTTFGGVRFIIDSGGFFASRGRARPFCDDLRSDALSRAHIMEKKARSYSYRAEPYIPEPYEPMEKDEYVPAEVFPEPRGQVSMIHKTSFSKREIKKFSREVKYAEVAMVDTPEFIDWSEQSISFDRTDHPKAVPRPGHAALVLEAQIGGVPRHYTDSARLLSRKDNIGRSLWHAHQFQKRKIEFEVVDWESQYHAILGRPAFAKFMAVPHYAYLKLKMPGNNGTPITVHGSFAKSDTCDREFQKIASKFGVKEELNAIDAAVDHTQPADNRNDEFDAAKEAKKLQEGALIEFLRERWEIFAWEPSDMPGIPRELAEHALNVDPTAKPVQQSMRRFSEPKRKAIGEEINRLRKAGFIRELKEAEWVANPVMVPKKDTTALRMCIDYTGLNKHCPKDHFPLPRIDQIVDSTAGCDRLSFLDAYSGYNQIKLKKEDQELTAFITPHGVFCYNVMTFGLKMREQLINVACKLVLENKSGETSRSTSTILW